MSDSGDISDGGFAAADHVDVDGGQVDSSYVAFQQVGDVDPVQAAIDKYAHRNGAAPPRAQETSQDG